MSADFGRGQLVGKYEILTRVSVGGMAELYLAFTTGPGGFRKYVAVKQILPGVRHDEEFVKMFLDEARITASLSHPNIGQVNDLGIDARSGDLFLVMEFIAGQNLNAVLRASQKTGPAIPVRVACRIVRDACLGLHAAHSFVDLSGRQQPIVHRDVSPKNVMVSYGGQVKLIDFGIAKARGRLTQTQVGLTRGTLSYMAPEQLLQQPVDGRTDLFAMGVVFHELLTGRPLYRGPAAESRIVSEVPAAPSSLVTGIPRALDKLVARALEKRPEDRYQSAKAFAQAIDQNAGALADEEELASYLTLLFAQEKQAAQDMFAVAERRDATTADLQAVAGKTVRAFSAEIPSAAARPPALTTTTAGTPKPGPLVPIVIGALALGVAAAVIGGVILAPAPPDKPAAKAVAEEAAPPPRVEIDAGWQSPEAIAFARKARDAAQAEQLETAVATLRECVQQEPTAWDCHLLLGQYYVSIGADEAMANDEYELFLRLAPKDHPSAGQVRAHLRVSAAQQ